MAIQGSKEYTPEFKREAVALVFAEGYTLVGAPRNLGINRDILRRWKRELAQDGGVAFPGKSHQTLDQAEVHRLTEENRRLWMERDIVQKATAFLMFWSNECSAVGNAKGPRNNQRRRTPRRKPPR